MESLNQLLTMNKSLLLERLKFVFDVDAPSITTKENLIKLYRDTKKQKDTTENSSLKRNIFINIKKNIIENECSRINF